MKPPYTSPDACPHCGAGRIDEFEYICDTCKAVPILREEVARLKQKVSERDQLVRTSNLLAKEEAKILQRWKDHGLLWKEQRDRAIEIAERYQQVNSRHYQCMCRTCRMLSELKKELK